MEARFDRRRFLVLGGGGLLVLSGCSSSEGDRAVKAVGPHDRAVAAAEATRRQAGAATVRRRLTAGPAEVDLGGRTVKTWAFDSVIPGNEIRVKRGDQLEVQVDNELPEETTIHWHGLALRNDMDGVEHLTQSVIAPQDSFTYRFTAANSGTHWFHPHMGLQLDRGLYAPLIVEDPDDIGDHDVDEVIVLDDWLDGIDGTPEDAFEALSSMSGMHDMGGDHGSMSGHDMGGMSMPQSDLLGGDAGDVTYPLHLANGRPSNDRPTITVPGKGKARLRLINAGSDTAYRVALAGHRLTVTHADGNRVEPVEVDALLIAMGERYDVTVTPRSGVWALVALAEGKDDTAEVIVRTADARATTAPEPGSRPEELDGRLLRHADLRAPDSQRLAKASRDVDEIIRLTGSMMPYSWAFDGKPHPDHAPIEVRQGDRVRLRFRNDSEMWHPVHIHGHTFAVGGRSDAPRKDTFAVLPGETVAVEFDADNPGQWMVHCHNTYHLEQGMALVLSYVR